MKKEKKSRGKKALLVLGILMGVMLSINLVSFLLNITIFRNELDGIEPYGELIEVNGGNMHLHSMGNGEETIVLLPGWGVALPSADFGPLMRRLSENYTVVTVEYFGIGFSDLSDIPRSNENYTEEIREALLKAGFEPPYILMPHSASGIYSEYYGTKYPEEVSAIIMMDTTSSAVTDDTPELLMNAVYAAMRFSQATGMMRVNNLILPETRLTENGYTEKEITDYRLFSNHGLNKTTIEQSRMFVENITELQGLPFPESIPVLKLIAQETIDAQAKIDKDDGMGYQKKHLKRLGENVSSVVLDTSHFLYHDQIHEIAGLTEEFLGVRLFGEE